MEKSKFTLRIDAEKLKEMKITAIKKGLFYCLQMQICNEAVTPTFFIKSHSLKAKLKKPFCMPRQERRNLLKPISPIRLQYKYV